MPSSDNPDRRRILQLAAIACAAGTGIPLRVLAAAGTATATATPQPKSRPPRLVVNASGGAMGKSVQDAYGKVFTDHTGIPIEMTSPPDLGKLRAMVQSGNVEWDVTEINSTEARIAGKMGLLEPIDSRIVDRHAYPAAAKDPYALTTSVYSTMLSYRTDVFSKTAPRSWADFWDVKKFPGARSLWNSPVDNLEFALLADGVAADKLYPLDVDRAFRKLDQIRDQITVWWSSGAQQVQLLVDKEVVMSSGWNGRMANAINSGAPVAIQWNEAVIKQAYFGIPKGAPNAYWSQQFMAAMTDARAQATFANLFFSPGLNPDSLKFAEDKVRPYLPTEPANAKTAFWQNDLWWNENVIKIKERWQKWMLG